MRAVLNRLRQRLAARSALREDIKLVEQSYLFWPDWYAKAYRSELSGLKSLAEDYVAHGMKKGHWPSPLFNPILYLKANPDVAEAGVPPFLHYLRHGKAQGRALAPGFAGERQLVHIGMIEGLNDITDLSTGEASRLAQKAIEHGLDGLCINLIPTKEGCSALQNALSHFGGASLSLCVRLTGKTPGKVADLGPEVSHSLALALTDEHYFRSEGRPLILVAGLDLLDAGFLQHLADVLPDYRLPRPIFALESSEKSCGENSSLTWFDAISEDLGDLLQPDYRPVEKPDEQIASYPAILRSLTCEEFSGDSARIPALLLPWNASSPPKGNSGGLEFYSKDLLLNWARRCAGVSIGPASPGPVMIPYWDSSIGGPAEGSTKEAFEAARQYVIDWPSMRRGAREAFTGPSEIPATISGQPARPVLVYQMGKVGSTSIYEPLAQSYKKGPVFHVHALCDIPQVLTAFRLGGSQDFSSIEHLVFCDHVRTTIDQSGSDVQWQLITPVRDPVARTLSFFLHELWESRPSFEREWVEGFLPVGELRELLFQFTKESVTGVDAWWEDQLLPLTGFDVFAKIFPRGKGFDVFEAERFRMLLLRTENLSDAGPRAISEFLDMPFELRGQKLSAEERGLAEMRKSILSKPLPESMVEALLSTRTARHFYEEEELDRFRRKWYDTSSSF